MSGQHHPEPQIGIWWDDGKKIVAFRHSAVATEAYAGWCDSDYSHNDYWPEAAMQYGLNESAEYFSIPRGRVLWSPSKKLSRIYHGNETTPDRLALIAAEFGLNSWDAKRDIHYTTGGLLNLLFEDD